MKVSRGRFKNNGGGKAIRFQTLDDLESGVVDKGKTMFSGRRTSLTVPGQSVAIYSLDDANRPILIAQGSSRVQFGYDNAGRRTSLTLPNGVAVIYGYDSASELTGLIYTNGLIPLGNLTYSNDLAGRRANLGGTYAATGLPNAVSATAYNAND